MSPKRPILRHLNLCPSTGCILQMTKSSESEHSPQTGYTAGLGCPHAHTFVHAIHWRCGPECTVRHFLTFSPLWAVQRHMDFTSQRRPFSGQRSPLRWPLVRTCSHCVDIFDSLKDL